MGLSGCNIQFFAGEIEAWRWKKIWKYLGGFYDKQCTKGDKIYSHVMDKDNFRRLNALGPPPDVPYILREQTTLYVG